MCVSFAAAREAVIRSLSPESVLQNVPDPVIRKPEDRHVPTPDYGSSRDSDDIEACECVLWGRMMILLRASSSPSPQ